MAFVAGNRLDSDPVKVFVQILGGGKCNPHDLAGDRMMVDLDITALEMV